MTSTSTITSIFTCSLEAAFTTPILYDINKAHTGYGVTPKVIYCTDDDDWGKPGSSKTFLLLLQ